MNKEEIIKKGNKIFYSSDYSDDNISNEKYDYAVKKWEKLIKDLEEK